ncbi:family 16 glycoside hydrolase [Nibrella viscosa]
MNLSRFVIGVGWVLGASLALAQAPAPKLTTLPLNDLSAFRKPTPNWRIAGDATADLNQKDVMTAKSGTGVLVNIPVPKQGYGMQYDLLTNLEHGDLDLELDYMMAKGSNSGVYLQGRYEVQLMDSWGDKTARVGGNGSVYERWDESRPEGQKGYEGYPARQNVSKAPGLWQHLKISFQAPRFDAGGRKIENARMLRVELNGVPIHENVELSGPTRGPLAENEVALGPLRFQGDHGPVAFRNIRYVAYDKPRPELMNLQYTVYRGHFENEGDLGNTPPEAQGPINILTANVTRIPNDFLIRYTGTLRVKEPGEYSFNLGAPGGGGQLRINNNVVVKPGGGNLRGTATLPAGDLPFELLYTKFVSWAKPGLGLAVAGPGIREFVISSPVDGGNDETEPIFVDAPTNTLLRSFMDIPNASGQGRRTRVTHAVSVGSPEQVHYTYDMDKGAIVQVWRGDFLDTTPMWHSRGDGSSRPRGTVQRLGMPELFVGKLASQQAAWATDTTGSGYRPKGYVLDENDRPTFRYQAYGTSVEDAIRVADNGQGVRREVTFRNPSADLYARLAEGSTIEPMPNGMYMIDGKSYIVRVEDAGGATPVVRSVGGKQELLVPVRGGKLSYSILF